MAPEALEQTYKDEDAVNDVDDFRNAESEHYKMLFETSPEELLNKIVESKKLVTNFVSAEMKSMSGKVLCFVEIRATNSLLVFTGSGDSAETARAETCRNAIEYFRVVFDIWTNSEVQLRLFLLLWFANLFIICVLMLKNTLDIQSNMHCELYLKYKKLVTYC